MKKRFCGLLAAVFFFLLLCSCSGREPTVQEEIPNGIDCEGFEFLVLQTSEKINPFDYKAGSTYADMLLEHIASKEKELHFTLDFLYHGDEYAVTNELTRYAAVSLAEASVAAWKSEAHIPLAFSEVLYPLTYLEEVLDYTDPKFGGWGKLSLCMAHGVPYGVTPVMWPTMTSNDCFVCLFYNSQYIRDLGQPSPWEYYEQGKWTFEQFSRIVGDYAFTEGQTYYPALITHWWNFALGMWSANGVHMVGEDSTGKLIAGYETRPSAHAMEWARELFTKNPDAIELVNDYDFPDRFLNGECTMMIFDTICVPKIAAGLKEFGIAPFPLGPDISESGRINLCSAGYSIQIPCDVDEPDTVGYILNALCDPFEEYATEDSLIDLLYNTAFFNRDQAAYYASMYKCAEPTYQGVNGYIPFFNVSSELTGKKSISEILANAENQMDKYIEEYMGENYLFLKEIGFYK